jgi:hypothetical protein
MYELVMAAERCKEIRDASLGVLRSSEKVSYELRMAG